MREAVGTIVPGDALPFLAVPSQQRHEEVGDYSLYGHFPDEHTEFSEINRPFLVWHRFPLCRRTRKCHDVLTFLAVCQQVRWLIRL